MLHVEKAGSNRASGLKSVYDSKIENEEKAVEEGESTETGAGAYMEN